MGAIKFDSSMLIDCLLEEHRETWEALRCEMLCYLRLNMAGSYCNKDYSPALFGVPPIDI